MAAEVKATLDLAVKTVAEEKRFSAAKVELEKASCTEKMGILSKESQKREVVIQDSLEEERERSRKLAEDIGKQDATKWLWAGGGVGVGVLVGVVLTVGVGAYVYLAPSTR